MAYVDLTGWGYGTLNSSYSSSYNFLRAAIKLVYDDSASTATSYKVYAKVSMNFSYAQTQIIEARIFYYKNVDSEPDYDNYETYKDVGLYDKSGNLGDTYYWLVGTYNLGATITSPKFKCGWFGNGSTVGNAFTNNKQVSYTIPSAATMSFSTAPSSGGGYINAISNMTVNPILTWSGSATTASYTFTLPTATPTSSSYVFDGWTINGTNYNAGATVTLSGSATVYPRLHLNTISFSVSVNGTVTAYSNQTIGDPISTAPSIPSGYTLAGWSLTQSSTWSSTAPTITGSQPTVQSGWAGKTLYAVFTFTLSYKDTSSSTASTDTKYAQAKLNSYLRAQPYRSGYIFNCWQRDSTHTYQGGALYPATDLKNTQTFTGQWTAATWVPILLFKKTAP